MPNRYNHTSTAKILICEDELLFAEDLAVTLRDTGYEITGIVATGEGAVAAAEKVRPDLILMDINLAGEIDGIEAAKQIRAKSDIPVVYLTAHTEKEVFERAKHTEPYGYVSKPVGFLELTSTVGTALYKHEADRQVRESEARRAKAEALAGLHSWEWDIGAGRLVWSIESYRAFGFHPEDAELTLDTFINSVHEDDSESVRRALEDALNGTRPYDLEFRIVQPNGEERHLQSRGEIQRDAKGQPIRMHGMALDITDRKKAEEALRQSEERFRMVYESGMLGMGFCTPDGRILDANDTYLAMIHRSREDLLNGRIDWREITPPEHVPFDLMGFEELIATGRCTPYEKEYLLHDGTRVPVIIGGALLPGSSSTAIAFALDISDRKKAEEALRKSRERLSLALEGANVGIWEWDLTDGTALWDKRTFLLLGYEPNEFEANLKNWKRLIHPDDWPRVSEMLNLTIQSKLPIFEVEYRIRNKSGEWQWVQARGNVTAVDADGKPTTMAGLFADITEHKKTELALRKSEATYRFLTEHASDLIWTLDMNLRTTFVNPSIEKVLGYTPEERMRQAVEDQITPECLQFVRQRLLEELRIESEQGIQEGKSVIVDLDYLHKNGSVVCLQTAVTFIRDEKGTPTGLHGISRDITELKRSQDALKESEEKYRTVVEESFDGVFVQNGTRITFANSRLHKMLGYAPGELEGVEHWLIYHPDYRHITRSRAQARLRGESVTSRYEVNLLRKDGTSFPGEINAKVILFDREPQIQVWIRDLTEQKLLEKSLVEAQKMEAVGTLAGGIAHDFNNLLHIMSGHAELLEMELAQKGMKFAEMDAIRQAAHRGADLVRQILTFGRKVDTRFTFINLNDEVRNTERLLYRTIPKMIEIDLLLEEELGLVRADATQIEQMLINLAVNAKDAMPEGGKLTIETRSVLLDEDACRSHAELTPGRYVVLRVSDTGHGMEEDVLEHIFEPFFTTKGRPDGTGLGLATVFGIVKMHGGHIFCESEIGNGATFTIYLPMVDTDRPEATHGQKVSPVPGGRETILVVDDEPLIRDLAERMLAKAGYRVITAGSGKDAIEMYARHQSDIGLVILDLIMPEMGGKQCLEELLKINPQVKSLIASGFAIKGDTKSFFDSKARGTVSKPFDMRGLLRAVRQVLDCA